MKVKKSTHPSVSLLFFTFYFGIGCALCSSLAAVGALFPYGRIVQWFTLIINGLQDEGVLYLNGTGFAFALFGSFMISILSLLAFVSTLVAYRHKNIGKKPVMWAILLFGVAVLVGVG